ncbi:hypothetical protein FOZ60_006101 [Perkinsus olseni]|uniref:Phosphatidic acid phosphatase type 2/haloperoxidase domain-containing protein n=1 Tax=Perkinsus olseni TaxID=32597 RepID=A0A7J6NQ21_PEROL|nr:hypothetical protein FOZ60_006101 [Perkinsus olseni]
MLSSSSSIDECINRAVDFLTECDNESCRKGCVNMLLEVLSNPLIVSRVAPRTLERLVSTDQVFRKHLQRAVTITRAPSNPQLSLRDLSRLVETVSPRDSLLVIRRLDRLKGDMHALQQAMAVDPREVILWPAPPRGSSDSHKPAGMAFLTCLRGSGASEEILRRCANISPAACVPDWAIVLGPNSCPYGKVVTLPFSSFTWPNSPVFADYVAAFYSSVLFAFVIFAACATLLKRSKLWFEFMILFFSSWAVQNIAKRLAEAERPRGSCHITCGMPSGHALMSMAIMTVLLLHCGGREIGALALRWRTLDVHSTTIFREVRVALGNVLIIVLIFLPVPWSRVQLNDHSTSQIILGCGIGGMLGVCWYVLSMLSNAGKATKEVSARKRSDSDADQAGIDV